MGGATCVCPAPTAARGEHTDAAREPDAALPPRPQGCSGVTAPHGGRPHGKTRPRGRREGALGRRASSGACDLGLRLTVRIITAR